MGLVQDAVDRDAQLGPGPLLFREQGPPTLGDVVVAPLSPCLLLLPFADDQAGLFQLMKARIQRPLTPRERRVLQAGELS